MTTHEEQITVMPYQSINIKGGWAMVCPKCGTHVASGMNDIPKPTSATCWGSKQPKVLSAKR